MKVIDFDGNETEWSVQDMRGVIVNGDGAHHAVEVEPGRIVFDPPVNMRNGDIFQVTYTITREES